MNMSSSSIQILFMVYLLSAHGMKDMYFIFLSLLYVIYCFYYLLRGICIYMLFISHIFQQSRNPIASVMASSSSFVPPPSSSDAIKPESFDGTGFKRWQARTRLWMMELGLFWVLTEEPPAPQGEAVLDEVERTRLDALRARWEKANASALARLLAVLSNRLFDVYVGFGEARKVWTELNDKYAESDNGNESFMVASYLNFRMGDSRSVMEQIHELQLIVRDLGQYGCVLPENFLVNAILAKLPTSWRDFVTARRHLKQRLTLNELIAAINVEEKSKAGYGGAKTPAQANLVEHKNHPGKNVKKEKAKPGFFGPKTNTMKKKKKPEIICYVCGGLDQ
ncbi:uncharacterized protein LOC133884273 isoform X1 [Phragmites australis]|uniref:uncharacterized protein LOC133884273 isoform X1 n=1 Tax=Phragmites australis TaxID=29695 RepID=UPI002D771A19|nr:uncharacterized protein LOC133884273 isoform X1 [Phragmites australis]